MGSGSSVGEADRRIDQRVKSLLHDAMLADLEVVIPLPGARTRIDRRGRPVET